MDSNQGFFKARVLILAGLCLFLSGNVFSKEEEIESFRCGGRFIEYGMTMDDVLKTCPKSQHPSRQAQNSTTYYYEPKSKYSKRKYYEYNGTLRDMESLEFMSTSIEGECH